MIFNGFKAIISLLAKVKVSKAKKIFEESLGAFENGSMIFSYD
jgi:hypothetical protein